MMASIFFFKTATEEMAKNFIANLFSRGDFDFRYKISALPIRGYILRVYNLQNLNEVLLDLLCEEFKNVRGFGGMMKITKEVLDDDKYCRQLYLMPEEREIVIGLCHLWNG